MHLRCIQEHSVACPTLRAAGNRQFQADRSPSLPEDPAICNLIAFASWSAMETSDSMNLPVYETSPRGALAHSNRFRERLVIPATVSAILDEWARTTGHPHEEIVAPSDFRAASVVHGLEDFVASSRSHRS